jgi:hypothetical protein
VPFVFGAQNGALSQFREATYSPGSASLLVRVVLTPEVIF